MPRDALLLHAKLAPLRLRKRVLPRSTLIAKLREALDYRLTLVQAGTGYGKSTALAALADEDIPLFWYSLDEADADPQRFLSYLIATVELRLPQLSDAPAVLLHEFSDAGGGAWAHVIDALPDLFKPPTPETFPATLIRQLLIDPTTFIFIGYWGDQPAGYIYAQIIRRAETPLRYALDRLYIHHLSVNQVHQRQGVGQALIQAVIKLAKEQALTTIALNVWSLNTKARDFFAAQGFTVYNENIWVHLSEQK